MTSIHVKPLFGSASDREKATERQQLAADVARFQRLGGKVQVLGTTAIDKKGISRRQVVEGGADRRKSARKGVGA